METESEAVEHFARFLQCQLKAECDWKLGPEAVSIQDPLALEMWPAHCRFVRGLGYDKWMPFHVYLGLHESGLIRLVHLQKCWTDEQKCMLVMIFRGHARLELFEKVQLPFIQKAGTRFWSDPQSFFEHKTGQLFKEMLKWRRKTKRPMLTSAFRQIPERVLEDDDENLCLSICKRTQKLLGLGGRLRETFFSRTLSANEKRDKMSQIVEGESGFAATQAKCVLGSLDVGWPEQKLLSAGCPLGVGAQKLSAVEPRLADLCLEGIQERLMREHTGGSLQMYANLLLLCERKMKDQYGPEKRWMPFTEAVTLRLVTIQVQMCEYRQFLERYQEDPQLSEVHKKPACKGSGKDSALPRADNASGFLGVSTVRGSEKLRARFGKKYIGLANTAVEAARLRYKASRAGQKAAEKKTQENAKLALTKKRVSSDGSKDAALETSDNASGFKGVKRVKGKNRFMFGFGKEYLGTAESALEAARLRAAEIKKRRLR
jgi:hypothetical protein